MPLYVLANTAPLKRKRAGQVVLRLKISWHDGTTHILLREGEQHG